MLIKIFLLTLSLAAAAFAAGDTNRAANLVILDETAVKNLNLATAEAEETDFEETIFALGRIRVAPGHKAVVSSRVPGRAISVSAHIDTKIEKGAEAVVIESRQPGDPPPSVRLLAPITGHISAVKIAPGQPVEAADSLIEIVDLSSVHAVAALPEHLAHRVRLAQKGRIRATGYPDKEFLAEVEHLGTEADAPTGTIEVAFHVENPDAILRPGMRAEFSIITGKREGVMSIPAVAVQGDGAQRFVYIADYELKHAYAKTPVVLGAQNDRMVEVVSGVLPGDQVVTRGAYALVFAGNGNTSLKEALDAAHGHPHGEDGSELSEDQQKAAAGKAGDTGHSHAHGGGMTPIAMFFAGTTGLLFLLLLALGSKLRKRSPVEVQP
jgi:multidrug efflux pump subunit AcrA (membrane-fusion protein)